MPTVMTFDHGVQCNKPSLRRHYHHQSWNDKLGDCTSICFQGVIPAIILSSDILGVKTVYRQSKVVRTQSKVQKSGGRGWRKGVCDMAVKLDHERDQDSKLCFEPSRIRKGNTREGSFVLHSISLTISWISCSVRRSSSPY